jgi:hypothetical protein
MYAIKIKQTCVGKGNYKLEPPKALSTNKDKVPN